MRSPNNNHATAILGLSTALLLPLLTVAFVPPHTTNQSMKARMLTRTSAALGAEFLDATSSVLLALDSYSAAAAAAAAPPVTECLAPVVTTTSSSSFNDGLLTALDSFYKNQPLLSAFLTCSTKASAADWVAQMQSQTNNNDSNKKKNFQPERNLAFWIYGGLYHGMTQHFVFSHVYPHLFGSSSSVLGPVSCDMILLGPLVSLPIAYFLKATMAHNQTLQQGLERYVHDVRNEGLLIKYWSLWIPVESITFGVIPPHLRIVFMAAVSFVWLTVLSTMTSSSVRQEPLLPLPSAAAAADMLMMGRHSSTNNQATTTMVGSSQRHRPARMPVTP